MISDNGKTFRDSKVKSFAMSKNVSWKFNVPTASWWGGFFEICVKLVKRSLKKVTGNARLSYEELETILIEIEGVLNSSLSLTSMTKLRNSMSHHLTFYDDERRNILLEFANIKS